MEEYRGIRSGCLATRNRSAECYDLFTDDDRININMHFWSFHYSGRKSFVLERVNRHDVQRRRANGAVSRKNASFRYTFKCRDGSVRKVCNTIFLGILRLSPKDDTIVKKAFKNNVNNNNAHIDGWVKLASRASDEGSVEIFIESYHFWIQ
ncbi:hypothetical protein RRG08_024809 [Elysia crispata]|uniref:Uncharacterized protein n=1 Tax=Elysia crispata TaxID=231223 RepID=A0AAE0YKT5_9GAST|nr:hypothetical protein RRG08_024809 [Elysia crispata]